MGGKASVAGGRLREISLANTAVTDAQHGALVRLRVARRWLALRAEYAGRTVRGTSTRHVDPGSPGKGDVDWIAGAEASDAAILNQY